MVKDRRYTTVKALLKIGHFNEFVDLFEVIPKSIVARDLGMNNIRFDKLIQRPERFIIWDVERIAGFIEIDLSVLLDLILKDIRKRRPATG
jgi:hypothetical protein